MKSLALSGRGTFSEVRIINQHQVIKYGRNNSDPINAQLIREAYILTRLNHPNVVKIFGIKSISRNCTGLILENGGTDLNKYRVAGASISEKLYTRIYSELLSGLQHIHSHKIIHRDIKPGNILISGPGPGNKLCDFDDPGSIRVRICDFGLSKIITGDTPVTDRVGTLYYHAPEYETGYGTKADIWALGCTMHEFITGHRLFNVKSFPDLMVAIREHRYEITVPMLRDIFIINPDDRPDCDVLLSKTGDPHICLSPVSSTSSRIGTIPDTDKYGNTQNELLNLLRPKLDTLPSDQIEYAHRSVAAMVDMIFSHSRFANRLGPGDIQANRLNREETQANPDAKFCYSLLNMLICKSITN